MDEEVRKSLKLGPEFRVSVKVVVGRRRGDGGVVVARHRTGEVREAELRILEVCSRNDREEGITGFMMLRDVDDECVPENFKIWGRDRRCKFCRELSELG